MKINTFSLLLPFLMITACSNQYRVMDTDDVSFVVQSLDEVLGSSSTGGDLTQFDQLSKLAGASLYYSDSSGPYGSAMSVASFGSFAFMGLPQLSYGSIAEVRVFFVDAFTTQGRQAALLVAVKETGAETFTTKTFFSTRYSVIEDGEFIAVLGSGGNEELVLRTMYLEDEDLEAIIRLDVFGFGSYGEESYIGQFSTLVGYQN